MKRRNFLKHAGAAATALAFPAIVKAVDRKPTIRVLGTHVTLQEKLRRQAERDLGINIEYYPGGSAEVLLKASTAPGSFDIYEQWSSSIKVLWLANAIQPIKIKRLDHWDEINDLTKKGRISATAKVGLGDAPYKLRHVQADGTLGSAPSEQISFMPYVHNTDSYGYNANVIPAGIPYRTES